jgi:hypothetical protein
VKPQTFPTDIEDVYRHVDVRKAIMGDAHLEHRARRGRASAKP